MPHMLNCKKCKSQTPHELIGVQWRCLYCGLRQNYERIYREEKQKLITPLRGTQLDLFGTEAK